MDFFQQELWTVYGQPLAFMLMHIGILVGVILGTMAYYTYAERKVMGLMQRRQGPAMVGPFGLLQPIADGIKLLSKEIIIPSQANGVLFILAPILVFALSLIAWAVIPVSAQIVLADINVGILYLVAVSSLGVYGVIIAGWASNSKYAFLGALRSASQMVSYEVSMGLVIVCVLLCVGTLNQSEITGGFMVEYSAMGFALFFLGEYTNMIMMSAMTTVLFLGGWLPPFGIEALAFVPGVIWFALKTALIMFFFIWARATFPRYRYDQLMRLVWKVFLPFTLLWVVVVSGTLLYFDALP